MLSRGDNIGITFAESPAIRKIFQELRPRTIDDIAIGMALVRPCAAAAKRRL